MSNKWAKKEIEIAMKNDKGESELYNALKRQTYESALNAYDALCNDGHSGFSIHLTMEILNRLVKGLPLTSITEDNVEWQDITLPNDKYKKYQSARYTSLFKEVHMIDGKEVIKYKDIRRTVGVNINYPKCCFSSGLMDRVINEMLPIELPYYPMGSQIKVYTEDFLSDAENGDFDTVGIFYAIFPDGEKREINRYFHFDKKETIEIDKHKYNLLKEKRVK